MSLNNSSIAASHSYDRLIQGSRTNVIHSSEDAVSNVETRIDLKQALKIISTGLGFGIGFGLGNALLGNEKIKNLMGFIGLGNNFVSKEKKN